MSSISTGKLGEIITLLRLTQMGLEAEVVHVGTSDILVVDEIKTWRVQVKSSHIKRNGGNAESPGYQFCVSKGGKDKHPLTYNDCDIVALVAIPQERAIFAPVDHFGKVKTKRLKMRDFEQDGLEQSTWDACMDWYKNSN